MTTTTASKCAGCNKTESLKHCAKCQSEWYCSRDCQKAHWKTHKKTCRLSSTSTTPKGLDGAFDKPFHALDNRTWLHNRSEKDVYRLLIDSFRLRLDDDYKFEQINTEGSVFAGEPNSLEAFKRFLGLAKARPGLLPHWWSNEKEADCIALGMVPSNDWLSLECGPEKGDISDHYDDSQMPMQMRMFGEQVYGRGPGGQDSKAMRTMMMQGEAGVRTGFSSMLDMSPNSKRT